MNSCTCAPQGTTLDFIECAPCPPLMLNYSQFREHALSRQVCLTEICSIARRCRPEDPEVEADCFPVSSTTLYTTGYMTELFTDQPPSETVRDSTLVIIIIAFAVFLITVVAIVIWARKRCKIKDNGTAQKSENLKAIDEHPLHEAVDVHTTDYGTSTNPASSLCNKTNEDDNDKYCLNDETTGKTNPPDTDQLGGENVIQSTRL